jgi:hypothetical protein
MFLRKKAEDYNDNSCKYFGNGRIKMKVLNHQIDDRIIEKKIDGYN